MISIIAILYLLTGLLGVSAHTLEDTDAIHAGSDLPGQKVIYAPAVSCDKNGTDSDDYEPIRKELIVVAATVVTRLTQQPKVRVDLCAGCPPTCPRCPIRCPDCPPACCPVYRLSIQIIGEIEQLIELWDDLDNNRTRDDYPLDHEETSLPLVTSMYGEDSDSVAV